MKPPCPGLRYYITTEKNKFNYAKSYKCMVFIHLYDSVKNFIKMEIFLQFLKTDFSGTYAQPIAVWPKKEIITQSSQKPSSPECDLRP
mgnify:FL=1